MSDIVIKAEHLSKYYHLGVINNGTFVRDIQTWWALKHGKEDPHGKIGAKKYDATKEGFWALKDLNFEIHQGDRIGVIGKNGAGKSTLLKILSRITAPSEGKVKIKGRIASLLEVGTGFHAELTGRENIYLNGAILGMKRREVDAKIDEIIAFSEIEQHIDTPVKRYSSGMYVRLAFAVAAHLDSEILIADEVLAVGDAAFQKKALDKMNELSAGQGRTVLFVSHNMTQVKRLCNKGIILDHGSIIRQDNNIEDSIKYYIGTNEDGQDLQTTVWQNDNSFHNDNFNPLKLSIKDSKGKLVTSALDYNKSYRICLEFESNQPDSNVDYWLTAFLGTETVTEFRMSPDYKYKKGKSVAEWIIPAKSFLPNEYVLSLGSSVKNTEWIINPVNFDIIIKFTVCKPKHNLFIQDL